MTVDGVDALYAVRPEEFVAARAALVKELKADGQKAEAAQVAKRRRPSVVAWALNQVAREQPKLRSWLAMPPEWLEGIRNVPSPGYARSPIPFG